MKTFEVTIKYEARIDAISEKTYEIEADTKKEAEKIAFEKFDEDVKENPEDLECDVLENINVGDNARFIDIDPDSAEIDEINFICNNND